MKPTRTTLVDNDLYISADDLREFLAVAMVSVEAMCTEAAPKATGMVVDTLKATSNFIDDVERLARSTNG